MEGVLRHPAYLIPRLVYNIPGILTRARFHIDRDGYVSYVSTRYLGKKRLNSNNMLNSYNSNHSNNTNNSAACKKSF